MPRRYVDEFSADAVEVDEDQYIDMEQQQVDQDNVVQNVMPQMPTPGLGI